MNRVAELVLELPCEYEGPWCMDTATKWRQQAHSDIAELVAKSFDRDRSISRHAAGLGALIAEITNQVACSERIESVFSLEPRLGAYLIGDEPTVEVAT